MKQRIEQDAQTGMRPAGGNVEHATHIQLAIGLAGLVVWIGALAWDGRRS